MRLPFAGARGRANASLSREHLRPSLPDRLWRFRSYPSSSSRPVVINARGSPERSPACCQAIFACSFPGVGHFRNIRLSRHAAPAASGTGKRNSGKHAQTICTRGQAETRKCLLIHTGMPKSLAPVFLLSKSRGRSDSGLAWTKLMAAERLCGEAVL
jgi:hypothetical protein